MRTPGLVRHSSRLAAAVVAIVVAIVAGWLVARDVPPDGGDFAYYWRAAHALLSGKSPYDGSFIYPLPSILVVLPLVGLSAHDGVTVFMGVSVGLMTYALVRARGWASLVIFLSPAFWDALYKLQWSPLLMAAALLPPLGFLASGKATIGVAALAYQPTRWGIGGFIGVVAISFLLIPTWPLQWRSDIGAAPAPHTPPLLWLTGAMGVLGALRWREPRGRLLLACTLIPASAQLYDHLLLWLATRDWRESLVLTVTAWLGFIALLATAPHDLTKDASGAQFSIAASVYAVAGLMMLIPTRSATVPVETPSPTPH